MQRTVKLLGGGQVVAERLLDNDSSSLGTARLSQLLDNRFEQKRWNGQIKRRPLRATEFFAKRLKSCRISVVAVHVSQKPVQLLEGGRIQAAMFLHTVPRPLAKLIEVPAALGDADYRHVEMPAFHHGL